MLNFSEVSILPKQDQDKLLLFLKHLIISWETIFRGIKDMNNNKIIIIILIVVIVIVILVLTLNVNRISKWDLNPI